MQINESLCVQYLGAPQEHWQPAQAAAQWIERDFAASRILGAALCAMKGGRRSDACRAMHALKDYALRTAPEHAEGAICAVFALALPQTIDALRADGVPEAIILDTLRDYGVWASYYLRHTGKVGLGEFDWECNFHTGCIVKLGRIQYETTSFSAPYTMYRRKSDQAILPVLHAGIGVTADGLLAMDDKAAFISEMRTVDGRLRCNRIDEKAARILPEIAEYDMADLELVLTTGMPTLHMHIPEGGPLDPESVSESLAMAEAYFGKRGYPNAVAVCESWLLDSALQEYGTGAKNILSFQECFVRFPWDTDGSEAVDRVFGRGTDVSDPDALPSDTSLRRGLREYLKTGKPLRDTGGLLVGSADSHLLPR